MLGDGLLHIDDMRALSKLPCTYLANYSLSQREYTTDEILKSSARIQHRGTTAGLNKLQIVHLKLGHASEDQCK